MADPRVDNHITGLEQQIVELVERRERARVQGRPDEEGQLQRELDALYAELADSAELVD